MPPMSPPARARQEPGGIPEMVADEQLMLLYQHGDRRAFEELVRRHQLGVFSFAFRHLGNRATAEEVAQEAFLRVVAAASDFKHEARFTTWLYTITRNLCTDELRRRRHRGHPSIDVAEPGASSPRPLAESVSDLHPAADAERTAAAAEVKACLVKAVAELPDDQREVFLLREIACLPFREIAKVTSVGENTVKSRMRYALERLQSAMAAHEEHARSLR